ncbi:MAG: glutaminyl-tRNA synthase (glutamine-hydrolyzing) subunit A [Parcubacteria group bacterium GW2011_GWA2_38_13b]|nr:MAG: glutaminyl-tRNA synthase (glutamine-hydrolyzing) subunit A [Parcubacteria group bacterium GW2011_GWA2_38_13b]
MDLFNLTIKKAHNLLVGKKVSSAEITRHFLDVIKKKDGDIRAFLAITEKLAMKQAKKVDDKIAKKENIGLLEGVPCAVKDNILIKNEKCTAGSKILENYVASYDATVIKKLKNNGVVALGKTNLDEFAMGSSTENSAFGPTKNPCDLTRVPGGSSGGSAAAVAADECIFALGSDTGGSVRQPAAFCGAVGLKPTYGSVSRYGLIAMASSLDVIGPITKTVEDAEIIFNAIKGKDKLDSTTIESNLSIFPPEADQPLAGNFQFSKNLKIGVPKEYFIEGMDRGVEECVRKVVDKLGKNKNIEIKEVSLPHTQYALAVYYILMPAEVSANLARYDGIRYGKSASAKNKSLLDFYLDTRGKYLGFEARRRIMLGSYVLSEGHFDDYYQKAGNVSGLIKEDFRNVFREVDLIVAPTTPNTAFKIGEKAKDPMQMYLSDIFTVASNIAGIPAMSVPCGFAGKMPVGLQVIGPWSGEDKIFALGKIIELLV